MKCAIAIPIAAASMLVGVAATHAQVALRNTLDGDGLACGDTRHSLTTISASLEGANEARLRQIGRLDALVKAVTKLNSHLPGYSAVDKYNSAQTVRRPWPTTPDPHYISIRKARLAQEDFVEASAIRALAHEECQQRFLPSRLATTECEALVKAEAAADPLLTADLARRIKQALGTSTRAGFETALSQMSTLTFTPGEDLNALAQRIERDAGGLAYALYKLPPGFSIPWGPPTPEITHAALGVPFKRPDVQLSSAPDPGTESFYLVENERRCPSAMFYISPTRALVRHTTPYFVDGAVTLCVDTTGFAIDKPLQVTVSTPAADRIYSLWPGELQTIPIEVAKDVSAQVAHITVSGYPRGEVLRALAGNRNGPLESLDSFELIKKAADTENSVELEALTTKLAALRTFRDALASNADAAATLEPLSELLAKADSTVKVLRASIGKARGDLKDIVDRDAGLNSDKAARELIDQLIPKLNAGPLEANDLRAIGKLLQDFPKRVKAAFDEVEAERKSARSERARLDLTADKLCAVANELIPLISEDVLVRSVCLASSCPRLDAHVIQYDFAGGFQPVSHGRLLEDQSIFIQVRNVLPGWSIGASIDNTQLVQRNTTLIGFSRTTASAVSQVKDQSTQLRQGLSAINPLALEVQPPQTQILQLGTLAGGARYDLRVCATNSTTEDCVGGAGSPSASTTSMPAAPSSGTLRRTIGLNTVHVQSVHHIGVRAGFAFTDSIGTHRDLIDGPGVGGHTVREQRHATGFGIPVLLSIYPYGRDAAGLPPPLSAGFVGGLDVLKIGETPRFYLGGVADFYGFGLTLGYALERISTVTNAAGVVIPADSQVQRDLGFRHGFFVALTTDFDIFQAIYSKLFKNDVFPSLPEGGP